MRHLARTLAVVTTIAVSGRGLPSVAGAQTPRVTPPPPCRAAPADTALLNVVRASAKRGFTSVAVLEFDSRVMELSRAHVAPAITAQLRSRLATGAGFAVESRGTV